MTELEKLKLWSKLVCTVFQHSSLKVLPTWCHAQEREEDITNESYVIGWQNKRYIYEINVEINDISTDPNKYGILFSYLDNDEFKDYDFYTISQFINSEGEVSNFGEEIIKDFIGKVNKTFGISE